MIILLATDGSEYSHKAAQFLMNLDLSENDEIIINHIISAVPFRDDQPSYSENLKRIKQEIAPKIIESCMKNLGSINAKISTVVSDGFPDRGITLNAEDSKADLIVMGSKGLKGFKSFLIGSVTRAVAISSTKPVLVIKPPQGKKLGNLKILLATDGSEYAYDLGRFLTTMPYSRDTEVDILHVIQSGLEIPERLHIDIEENIKKIAIEIRAAETRKSESIIEHVRTSLGNKFTNIKSLTKDGDPAAEILDTAKTIGADIIAVGSKGMRGIKGMLGSVSRYVLGHAECSVLIGKTNK
jgi:nucleotide-binding universal stress UspA family protein